MDLGLSSLLVGLLPLVVFVVVDSLAGLKSALIFTVIFALLELAFSLYFFKSIDWITGLSFLLVLLMVIVSYRRQNPLFIKLQPALLGFFLSAIFLGSFLLGKSIMYEFMLKYREQLPSTYLIFIDNPYYVSLLKNLGATLGASLLIHAGLMVYAAYRWSNLAWLLMKGIGFYVFSFLGIILAALVTQSSY